MFKTCPILAAVVPIMETLPLQADRGYLKVKLLCVLSLSLILPLSPYVFNFFKLSPVQISLCYFIQRQLQITAATPKMCRRISKNPPGAPCDVRAYVTRTSSNYQLEVIKAQRDALCVHEKCVQAAKALLGKFLSQNY